MRAHMTLSARRELALRTAVRYKNAARPEKNRILDEFLESTGFHRKHATRLLNEILRGERPGQERRGRIRRYGPAVQDALIAAWRTVNYVCGKRLVPFLPELIPAMERHGHLSLSDDTRARLLEMSAATADRIFPSISTGSSTARQDHDPVGTVTQTPHSDSNVRGLGGDGGRDSWKRIWSPTAAGIRKAPFSTRSC